MSSENLHAPRERLSKKTLTLHHAVVSLMEELDAIDWYRQRADDTEDETLKGLLLHNMREEMEHASMLLEYIRRSDGDFERYLKTYLFTKAPILEVEDLATEQEVESERGNDAGRATERANGGGERGFTIGPLKGN
ncbi:MAG TPA: ferritin [Stellaceae bacterium]